MQKPQKVNLNQLMREKTINNLRILNTKKKIDYYDSMTP